MKSPLRSWLQRKPPLVRRELNEHMPRGDQIDILKRRSSSLFEVMLLVRKMSTLIWTWLAFSRNIARAAAAQRATGVRPGGCNRSGKSVNLLMESRREAARPHRSISKGGGPVGSKNLPRSPRGDRSRSRRAGSPNLSAVNGIDCEPQDRG